MRDDLLIVIPAPLHKEGVPRMVLRPLHHQSLLTRMIDLASQVVGNLGQIRVITDGEEVALLANRKGCHATISLEVSDPLSGNEWLICLHNVVKQAELERGSRFSAVMLLSPFSPLIKSVDIYDAIDELFDKGYDSVVSACIDTSDTWKSSGGRYSPFFSRGLSRGPDGEPLYRESGCFVISKRLVVDDDSFIGDNLGLALIPTERAIDIRSKLEWWACERLLGRRRIVFVVVGHTAVGLGHVNRTELLAHEFIDHDVSFVCTQESSLAAERLNRQPLPVYGQTSPDLAEDVLALEPDLVVNDILDTQSEYVSRLKQRGVKVVNFEDLGPGADLADLVVNAIYDESGSGPNRLNGPKYFCIRDEFLQAIPKSFSDTVEEILITFGGTDPQNNTYRVARLVLPTVLKTGTHVSIVTGPGYLYDRDLRQFLSGVPDGLVELANGTGRISEYMERADLAFSSAGRTVFELAAMRVPGIIIASNQREETHTFAREEQGMRFLGRSDLITDDVILNAFQHLMDSASARKALRYQTNKWDFELGRQRVIMAINSLLDQERY